jgi:hypothetical protein
MSFSTLGADSESESEEKSEEELNEAFDKLKI